MTKFENRDPANTPVTHNSGSMRPTPSGPHHDPRAGGEVKPRNHVPVHQGGDTK
jgi:hypothetical protein